MGGNLALAALLASGEVVALGCQSHGCDLGDANTKLESGVNLIFDGHYEYGPIL